jgi:O-antigen/teichoic acid export membrane protein
MAAVGMFRHLRNYVSAGILSALVGLVTFPILTRNLSVAEYGIVGLITSSLTLSIAIGKLGVQHSVIRFFSQIENNNIDFSVRQMNSTVSMVFFVFACTTTALWLLSGFFVLPAILQYENIPSLFLLASGIVFIRLLGSGVMNFLRAQQRSADVAISQSLARFLNLFLIVLLLLVDDLDPWTVIGCLLVAETLGVLYAAYQYLPDFQFRLSDVSARLARALLVYGLPLMILESLGLVLRLSDRYLIESMLGVSALGQYSASYNFTSYIDIIILASLMQAVKPAYMQMWESEGRAPTQQFLSGGFHLYMVIGIPFIAMFAITSPHLLNFLAGAKYAPGTVIIPYVAASFWLEGAMHFLAAGLYIYKDTKILMAWSLVATVANLTLNILLIPRFGITGAAVVTIVSYLIFMMGVTSNAFRHVGFPVKLRAPLLMVAASLMVFVVLDPIQLGSDLVSFLFKGLAGTSVLLILIWVVDPGVKRWMSNVGMRSVKGMRP